HDLTLTGSPPAAERARSLRSPGARPRARRRAVGLKIPARSRMTDFRRFQGTDRYLTSEALEAAVNCALVLERPLLVKGEPGTGKTLLAEAIAEGLGRPLIRW